MKYLVAVLLLCSVGVAAQTVPPKTKPTIKPAPSRCAAETKDAAELRDMLKADLERERAKVAQLEKANGEMGAKLAESDKKWAEARPLVQQVLEYTAALETEYKKTLANLNTATDKYNSTLQTANSLIEQQNQRLARQQRVSNALAIYSLMPHYTPPQTFNVNVTDCSKYPALCVH